MTPGALSHSWRVLVAWACLSGVPFAQDPPQSGPPPADPAAPPPAPAPRKPRGWNDKRRTMRSYGSNLLYNTAGVLTTGNHGPLLVTAALAAPAFAWDDEVVHYFGRHPHRDFGKIGQVMGGTLAVGGITVGAFSAGRILSGGRYRAATYDLSQAIIVTQIWTQALKFAVQRERPDGSNRLSFPSGHSSNAFTAAVVVSRHYPRLSVPGYGIATYIAVSRLAADKHHFSDVVAGAGFGWGVGRAVVRRNSRPPDTPGTKDVNVTLGPDTGPSGDGSGLALRVTF